MEIYTWEEVVQITKQAGGKMYCPPFNGDSGDKFELKKIDLNDVNKDHYLTVKECEKEDLDEDLSVIAYLINSYNKGHKIPPIILNHDLIVIDGSHRLGALSYLGHRTIEAFVKL